MEQSILISEGLNQINITNANLNALESRLQSYLNKPKDVTRTTKNSYIDLMIPNIKFNFESAISNHTKSPVMKPDSNLKITDLTKQINNNNMNSIADSEEVIIKSFSNHKLKTKTEREEEDEKQIQEYRTKINSMKQKDNFSKLEEFYQNRNRLLEEQIQGLELRKNKIKREKDLLRKENNRLMGILDSEKENLKNIINLKTEQNDQQEFSLQQKVYNKLNALRNELQKEREIQKNLKTQKISYQNSLKLFLQTHKNILTIDLTRKGNQESLSSTSFNKTKKLNKTHNTSIQNKESSIKRISQNNKLTKLQR